MGKKIAEIRETNICDRLAFLDLSKNNITGEDFAKLRGGDWFCLNVLKIGNNPLGDEGMKHIKIFVSLTHLELWNCEITGRGAEELQNLKFLKHLCLSRNKIKDDGIHNIKDI